MQSLRFALIAFALVLAGCGDKPVTLDEYNTQVISLPSGKQVRAEVLTNPIDMRRGMMFRDSLAPDRGMLFVHGAVGRYQYWMYQTRIPLDIIWLDKDRRIVEISANTPPCTTKASGCPQYGGNYDALFVLELAGGMAARYGLRVGDTLSF